MNLTLLPLILTTTLLQLPPAETEEAKPQLPWSLNTTEAKAQAAKEGKDLFILFTGSDWCHWCKTLDSEVLTQAAFLEKMTARYVYLYLDFPNGEEAKAKVVDAKLNADLQGAYGVQGFPTIILASATGAPYARSGYEPGGPDQCLKTIDELTKKAEPIKKMMASKEPTAEQLLAAFPVLAEQNFLGHPAYASCLLAADKADPDGKKGLKKMVVTARENSAFESMIAKLPRDREPTDEEWQKVVDLLINKSQNLSGMMFAQVAFGVGSYLFDKERYTEAKAMFERSRKDPELKDVPQAQEAIGQKIAECDEKLKGTEGTGGGAPEKKDPGKTGG